MQDLFRFIITVFVIYVTYVILFYALKRTLAIKKISELKKLADAKITYLRFPFLSFFKLSAKPDAIIEIGEKIYLVRLINGKGPARFLHFASREFFVTYSKISFSVGALLRLTARGKGVSSQSTSRQSVKILPSLEVPSQYTEISAEKGKELVPVLMFSPVPNEITFVSETRTTIKLAFEGDDMYGQKIFTPSAFVTYTDRVYREEKRRAEDEFIWR